MAIVLANPALADNEWTTLEFEQEHVWNASEGAADYLEWTLDGSMLLVLGTGGPRRIQLLGRDLAPLGAVEAPFDVRGASWSMTKNWLVAWGPDGIRDALMFWDVPSLAPNATVVSRELLTLTTITAARFFSTDEILVVAGRNANGTSRVNVVEVFSSRLHRDLEHPDNRTTRFIFDDGHGQGVLVESGGYLRGFPGFNWDTWGFLSNLTGEVTAQSIVWQAEWLAGDANGVVRLWSILNGSVKYSIQLDRGPAQAVAYIRVPIVHNLIAYPAEGGGSHLQVWREHVADGEIGSGPFYIRELNFTSSITMMEPIPGDENNLTVAHADGSIAILQVTYVILRSPPPQPDNGNGANDGDGDDDGGGSAAEFWATWGYLVVLLLLAGALGGAYVWLARREGRGG